MLCMYYYHILLLHYFLLYEANWYLFIFFSDGLFGGIVRHKRVSQPDPIELCETKTKTIAEKKNKTKVTIIKGM